MSNRERWIIYPLLFFAIALATKAKLDQALRLDTEELVCRQLTIVDGDGNAKVRLVSDQHGGFVALMNSQREMAAMVSVSPQGGGVLQLSGTQRANAISLIGNSVGGQVRVAGSPKQPVVVLGFAEDGAQSGLYALHDNLPLEYVVPAQPRAEPKQIDWGVPLPPEISQSTPHSASQAPELEQSQPDPPTLPPTSEPEPVEADSPVVQPEAAAASATGED